MKKEKKILERRLGKYAILTGAALTTMTACSDDGTTDNANVEYTDITDVNLTATTNNQASAQFDIDGDGTMDFGIEVSNYKYAAYGVDYNYAGMEGLNGNRLLTTQKTVSYTYGDSTVSYDADFATPLNSGNSINASKMNTNGKDNGLFAIIGTYYNDPIVGGDLFAGKEAYVGLEFDISGAKHYGWIRVNVSANGSTVIIKDHAYNKVAGEELNAGDI